MMRRRRSCTLFPYTTLFRSPPFDGRLGYLRLDVPPDFAVARVAEQIRPNDAAVGGLPDPGISVPRRRVHGGRCARIAFGIGIDGVAPRVAVHGRLVDLRARTTIVGRLQHLARAGVEAVRLLV